VTIDKEYLDRTARFAVWFKGKREQAGLTQRELARLGDVSPSYLEKLETCPGRLERHGDKPEVVNAPGKPDKFIHSLEALASRLGDDGLVEEGLKIWGHAHPRNGRLPHPDADTSREILGDILDGVLALSPESLRLVRELVDRLR
jgi:hypothetical protein